MSNDLQAQLSTSLAALARSKEECAELVKERDEARAQLDEREADMHMRIRLGYDKTVADAWRAENARLSATVATLRGELDELACAAAEQATCIRHLDEQLAVVTAERDKARTDYEQVSKPIGFIEDRAERDTASAIAQFIDEHYCGRDDDPHDIAADIRNDIRAKYPHPTPVTAAALDDSRCAICGWPLQAPPPNASTWGCVRGDCSQRPMPERLYDPERAARENPLLSATNGTKGTE